MSRTRKDIDNEALARILQERLNERGEGLAIDGWGGLLTQAALARHLPPAQMPPSEHTSQSETHYRLARSYLGVREEAGPGTHPRLREMWSLMPIWLDKDDSKTAWCGIFRAWLGHLAGTGIPANSFRAASWAAWGKAVRLDRPSAWKRGDTIVMTRTGGNHVALLDRVEGDKVYCLGGNQSNAVTIAPFSLSRITHVRR